MAQFDRTTSHWGFFNKQVAFYERHGFVVVAELLEPKSGVLIRGMRRDPR